MGELKTIRIPVDGNNYVEVAANENMQKIQNYIKDLRHTNEWYKGDLAQVRKVAAERYNEIQYLKRLWFEFTKGGFENHSTTHLFSDQTY